MPPKEHESEQEFTVQQTITVRGNRKATDSTTAAYEHQRDLSDTIPDGMEIVGRSKPVVKKV